MADNTETLIRIAEALERMAAYADKIDAALSELGDATVQAPPGMLSMMPMLLKAMKR